MSTPEAIGQQTNTSTVNDYTARVFVIQQMLQQMQTATLVKVMAVTNTGGISPVGFVDVLPLVNQMTGARVPVPHKVIYNIPYLRIQGGKNAVIIDPEIGDIGACMFASRDISSVKTSRKQSNPGSARVYDYADGMYFGGLLNGTPEQWVRIFGGGIELHTSGTITLDAPNVHVTGTLTADVDVIAAGVSGKSHTHGGVDRGVGNTDPPNS